MGTKYKPDILVDLDGVVFDIAKYMEPIMQDYMFSIGMHINCEGQYYDLAKRYGKEARDLFFNDFYEEYLDAAPLIQYADKYLRIIDEYFRLHLITSRGVVSEATDITEESLHKIEEHRQMTLDSLRRNKIPFYKLEFVVDKMEYIRANHIRVVIEDKLETLLKVRRLTNAQSICFNQPWNMQARDTYKLEVVNTWPHLAQLLINKLNRGEFNEFITVV